MTTTPFRATVAAGAVAVAAAIACAPMASAAPATAAPSAPAAPVTTTQAGDGFWAPSHDEATALIPVCSGPAATFAWLSTNFADHGRDLNSALRRNAALVQSILRFSATPYQVLETLFADVLQVPVYAVNDVAFHQPTTVKDIITFCASTRQ